jgi:hypothetical protein
VAAEYLGKSILPMTIARVQLRLEWYKHEQFTRPDLRVF